MPHSPGISASFSDNGQTAISQVLVPMILTSVPGAMPAPTAPRCASNAPTATGIPLLKPVRVDQSPVNSPATVLMSRALAQSRDRNAPILGESCERNSASGYPPQL